jgi:hypothetical protein
MNNRLVAVNTFNIISEEFSEKNKEQEWDGGGKRGSKRA